MSAATLEISPTLIADILAAAGRAYPAECCGLLEGVATKRGWRVGALHETKNLGENPRRGFLVDPEVQFRLLRSLRGTERDLIGCFHSHPGGKPAPSEQDRANAGEDGFLWLVAAGENIAAFVYRAADKDFFPVAMIARETGF